MIKVVLFKSESEDSDWTDSLTGQGFEVALIPSIDFRFKNLDILKDKFKNIGEYEGVIFTSPRSILATQQSLSTCDDILELWRDKKNYTIGEASQNLAKTNLKLNSSGSEAGNAERLAPIIAEDYRRCNLKGPFLFPCGNQKQDILGENLRKHGISLDYTEVYETIAHPNLEEAIKKLTVPNFIVYFSPTGVKYSLPFLRKYQVNLAKTKLIAIGPSTLKCLQNNNLECYKMCAKPSPESLLEILKDFRDSTKDQ